MTTNRSNQYYYEETPIEIYRRVCINGDQPTWREKAILNAHYNQSFNESVKHDHIR